jgi:hypothetical protein
MQVHKKTFGAVEYSIIPFDAMEAHQLLVGQLAKIGGPIFAAFAAADAQSNIVDLAPKLGMALATLNEPEIEALTLKLLSRVVAQGVFATSGGESETARIDLNSKAKINKVFATNLKGLYQVMGAVLEVNYRGFFADLGLVA